MATSKKKSRVTRGEKVLYFSIANGLGKGMTGKSAPDVIVKVPVGTVITDQETGLIIGDLTKNGEEVIVATGGRGGKGNMALATRTNLCPSYAENGEPGETRKVKVELKLLADVGLVGMPSVGKSTFISDISASRPKIAAYHFTTLSPNLGVVKTKDNRSFVVADLPGLIEGASLGEGLGDQFLKHIERTRVIAHIVDMGSAEGRDPIEDYKIINNEFANFKTNLLNKKQIVIANKMDLPGALENLERFKREVNVEVYPISAVTKEGIDQVLYRLADILDEVKKEPLYDEEKFESHILYKFEEEKPFEITNEDGVWVIKGEKVEKILKMTKFQTDESILRFANKLRKLGIDDKLRELGASDGDTVRILDLEFEFQDND